MKKKKVIKKKEGKNNYNYSFYDCAYVIGFSIQQCGQEFLIKNININQSAMFARILVLEWMLLFSPVNNVGKSF